jgi:hypothetical protein
MKRALIALLAGAAAFGSVFAFAAALGVTSNNLGAGQSPVAACTSDNVHASYDVEWEDTYFQVTDVHLAVTAENGDCNGQAVQIAVLAEDDGETLATASGTITGDAASFDVSTDGVDAHEVGTVHVVITNAEDDD